MNPAFSTQLNALDTAALQQRLISHGPRVQLARRITYICSRSYHMIGPWGFWIDSGLVTGGPKPGGDYHRLPPLESYLGHYFDQNV